MQHTCSSAVYDSQVILALGTTAVVASLSPNVPLNDGYVVSPFLRAIRSHSCNNSPHEAFSAILTSSLPVRTAYNT
jgi:hypothetical protein